MQISSMMLKLLLLSCLLGLTIAQLKYENHISVLNRLSDLGSSQDEVARSLSVSLKHVNTEDFFSVLDGHLESHTDADLKGSDTNLRFQRESPEESSTGVGLGQQCVTDMLAYIQHVRLNMTLGAPWALRMADATGKPGAGLLAGNFMFLGDFDECRAITAKYKVTPGAPTDREFTGQYCLGQYSIHVPPIPPEGFNYLWAVCIPDSCTESDALQIANLALQRYHVTQISFDKMTCNMRTVPWTPRAIGVFTMVGVIAFLVALGTIIDIMYIQVPKWNKAKKEGNDSGKSINGDSSSRHVEIPRVDESWRNSSDTEPLMVNRNYPPQQVKSEPSWPPFVVRVFVAFSAFTNAKKLLNFQQPPGALTCLNGIRVLSINWVVLGHTCLILILAGNNVAAYLDKALNRWSFQIIVNGTLSVDTFFVMSGLLVTYATLGQMKKTGGKVNWLKFYVHRYMRLTPVYMITIGIYFACLPYLFNGPLMPQRDGFEQDHHCQHNWWGNLLYVQNLVKFKPHYCAGWGWYLAVDMQFYILSPLLIIPLYHRPKLAYIITALLFVITTVTPFVLTETRNYSTGRTHLKGNPKKLGDQNYDLYIAPYCRIGTYLVGVLTGFILYRTKDKPVRMHRAVVLAGWVASIVTGVVVVYGLKDYFVGPGMSIHLAAVYNAFGRIAWGLAVAWVIFCCHTGYGGLINSFLSWSIWAPLGRLTYVVYLIHMALIMIMGVTARTPFYASDWTIVRLYLASLMASYSVALVLSLLFEAPGLALEKVLLEKKKK